MSREYSVCTCLQCPMFAEDADGKGDMCMTEIRAIDVDIEIGRPEWCPLNDGPITIKAGEP